MANMQTRVPSDGWGDVDEMTSRATVDLLQWLDEEERREGDPSC